MYDYSRQDLIEGLRAVGLKPGDEVLFHVSLAMLGLGEGITDQESMNALFLECAREVLGPEGTIFVPTYSYSLGRGELFDTATTPATIGAFSEFFRIQPDVVRSVEPMLSMCGQGPAAEEVLGDLPATSFGADSVYDRLTLREAKICMVGLRLNWATFLHYIEERNGVPFRYRKLFSGPVLKDGKEEIVDWVYNVRIWGDNAMGDGVPLAEMALADGATRSVDLGRNMLFCIGTKEYVDYATKRMKENPWVTAAGPAADPIEMEETRVPVVQYSVDIDGETSPEDVARKLAPLPREVMSDAYNQALEGLAIRYGLTVEGYPTGTLGVDCIVPEKWTCHSASLKSESGDVIFDLSQSPLRVAAYSGSFSGEVDRETVIERCTVGEGASDDVAYLSAKRLRRWGFSCSEQEAGALTDAKYRVDIRSDFSYANMKIGSASLNEDAGKCVTLVAFLDGPCQFDSGLSGVLAGCIVLERLRAEGTDRAVRLLVLPRDFGLPVWIRQMPELVRNTERFIILDRLARGGVMVDASPAGETPEVRAAEGAGIPVTMVAGTDEYAVEGTDGDVVTEQGMKNLNTAVDTVLELIRNA